MKKIFNIFYKTGYEMDIAKATGIPTMRNGIKRKIGNMIINPIINKKK